MNTTKFMKDMNNVLGYSSGFLDGVQQGKTTFFKSLGAGLSEIFKQYVDSNARVNPQLLHHIYEWNQIGSPNARLFDIDYVVTGKGLSFNSTFRQSDSIKNGSRVPFYDKARVMEEGLSVTIVPKQRVLAFEQNGETVFTTKPVVVDNPGGQTAGEYEKVFREFFGRYFTQAFLVSSGVATYLKSPADFYKGMKSAKTRGRAHGLSVGREWIEKAGNI